LKHEKTTRTNQINNEKNGAKKDYNDMKQPVKRR